ncbi:hypothetical protein P389DRAFT_82863 [Cystobasidium minutum MCA 4210]|uniref:uncharacterized protein n=1 Tax=Cystobasidium minutum MCA 4210 TaxID=1397322 RepID=UPI0034D0116D|eukprot:jgi/Rhomi1/82863/CE82862_80
MLASSFTGLLGAVCPTTSHTDERELDDHASSSDSLLLAEEVVGLSPTFSSQASGSVGSTRLFQVRPVPGKGLGLIATSTISPGTLIFSEAPLIKLSDSELGYYRLEWEVSRLSPFDKAAFLHMHHTGMDELPAVLEIWRKNSLGLSGNNGTAGNGGCQQGIFKIISKINNSCTPNCSITWDDSTSQMNLHAVLDIAENDELTICYVNPLLARNLKS